MLNLLKKNEFLNLTCTLVPAVLGFFAPGMGTLPFNNALTSATTVRVLPVPNDAIFDHIIKNRFLEFWK